MLVIADNLSVRNAAYMEAVKQKDRKTVEGMARELASLGAEMINETPHAHPIHLHGHTFKVIASNKHKLLPHFADTTLVAPNERRKVAFVADNPGDWMLHCHIIEHQETGMMGYVRVA